MIKNPIIPGFAGDPCVIRVGDDYYLATSSFEWNPGVAVYHSLDLKHWELCDYILKEKRLNDLTGVYPSGGMWAPDLSYNEKEKRFYLVYNCVRTKSNLFFDIDNFITYSDSIHGPWCDPIYIGSNGFDPTLFIDDDGRKWIAIKDRDTAGITSTPARSCSASSTWKSGSMSGSPSPSREARPKGGLWKEPTFTNISGNTT